MSFLISKKDVISAVAYYGVRQSPYHFPKNLEVALEALYNNLSKEELFSKDDKFGYFDVTDLKEFYQVIKRLIFGTPEIAIWNVTQMEQDEGIIDPEDPRRKVKYAFVGRGLSTPQDRDFIDLHALAMNVYNFILPNDETESDSVSLS